MAVLHVKSPNGTTYNMTIVTSGVTESLESNGWCKFPNGLIMQWLYNIDETSRYGYFPIKFNVGCFIGCATHTITFAQSYSASPIAVGVGESDINRVELVIPQGHNGINFIGVGK